MLRRGVDAVFPVEPIDAGHRLPNDTAEQLVDRLVVLQLLGDETAARFPIAGQKGLDVPIEQGCGSRHDGLLTQRAGPLENPGLLPGSSDGPLDFVIAKSAAGSTRATCAERASWDQARGGVNMGKQPTLAGFYRRFA